MSLAFGIEKETPEAVSLSKMFVTGVGRCRAFFLCERDVTVREKWSTYETMFAFVIAMCKGKWYIRKGRGETGKPCRVLTGTGVERLWEPWKTRVHLLSERKEEIQSTI